MNPAEILTLALEKGLFAALFVFAFWFILTENKKREESQRDLFIELSDSLDKAKTAILSIESSIERIDGSISDISEDVTEVKFHVNSMDSTLKAQITQQKQQ